VEDLTPEQKEEVERHISSVSDSQLDGENASSDSSRPKKRRYKKDTGLKATGGITGVLIFGGIVAAIVMCFIPAAIPVGLCVAGGIVILGCAVAAGLLYATSISNAVELKRIRRSVEDK
jgi:tetrahydromethanopterin S-methyltransferase subunit F